MRVFIGWDDREARAGQVAAKSLREVTGGAIEPEFLRADKLAAQGLLTRSVDQRGSQWYDMASNAPVSTAFGCSRFLTPILAQGEWALFVDADMVFLRDPRELLAEAKAQAYPSAVYVVKHRHEPAELYKMVNQQQTVYPRKNWSSVVLFNAAHPANLRLSLRDVNERPGRDLHAFYWLADSEIGTLDAKWNWLVDVQPRPADVGIAHLTMGGPYLPGWRGGSFDAEWLATEARLKDMP